MLAQMCRDPTLRLVILFVSIHELPELKVRNSNIKTDIWYVKKM